MRCPDCGGELLRLPDKDCYWCSRCRTEFPASQLMMDEFANWPESRWEDFTPKIKISEPQ